MEELPIFVREVFDLKSFGIPEESFVDARTTLSCGRYICSVVPKEGFVLIADVQDRFSSKISISDDTLDPQEHILATYSPSLDIIVVKKGSKFEMFDVKSKSKKKEYAALLEGGPEVEFMKFAASDMLLFVTKNNGIYRWNMNSEEKPSRLFDRHGSTHDVKIQDCITDSLTKKWYVLHGYNSDVSRMQLYSVDRNVSQPINARACCFLDYPFNKKGEKLEKPIQLISLANPQPFMGYTGVTTGQMKIFILPLPNANFSAAAPEFDRVNCSLDIDDKDFPVGMCPSECLTKLNCVMESGQLLILDVKSGKLIRKHKFSNVPIIRISKLNDGFLCLNREGKVLTVQPWKKNVDEISRMDVKERGEFVVTCYYENENGVSASDFVTARFRNGNSIRIPKIFCSLGVWMRVFFKEK